MKRKGSALLIVLGMLAFVVVSAIAFSAYMRYARMPSSYLRRTSSSRLLAKAALAEAIDIIDNAIGNSAYAGQSGRQQIKNYKRITDEENPSDVIDYWQDRCFIGSNTLVSVDSTVATLCTEALAYIPPSIINEVRYYSRRSLAGQWHTLGFDSGRFAFTAVDVSDFLDINSVRAILRDENGEKLYGRNSSDRGRITLSHVFENEAHTGYNTFCTPEQWDTFMDDFIGDEKLPLVSLADMALAMNKKLPVTMNPFVNYIENGANFVSSESGPQAALLRNMAFVTDSWFAPTNSADTIDVSRGDHQPFAGSAKGGTLDQIYNISTPFLSYLGGRNTPLYKDPEIFQLYDYLDEDSIPLSLAIPTCERTPMITGVALDGALEVVATTPNPVVQRTATPGTPGVDFEFVKTTSSLELRGNLTVSAGLVFPFKYKRPTDGTFKAQAALTITFVPSDHDQLRRNGAKPVVAWGDSKQAPTAVAVSGSQPAYVLALSEQKTVDLKWPGGDVRTTEKEAVLDDQDFKFDFTSGVPLRSKLAAAAGTPFSGEDDCSSRVIRKYTLVANPSGGAPLRDAEVPNAAVQECGWLPMNAELTEAMAPAKVLDGTKYYPVVQVWVRVIDDKTKKTVDLSPANYEDDTLTGGSVFKRLGSGAKGSNERPLLRFRSAAVENSAVSFDATKNGLVVGASGTQAPVQPFSVAAYLACDPRFNYAPEDMRALGSMSGKFKDLWLTEVQPIAGDRDGDIFMTTSDAGYMQSAYEFANIVMTSANSSDKMGILNSGGYDGVATPSFDDCPANAAMWKTYSQYDSGSGRGYIDGLGLVSGQRGFRMNPYSPSRNVFLSALVNTPLDWWAASTNELVEAHDSEQLAAKYSFSEMSGAMVKMKYTTLQSVADEMMSKFRSATASGTWETIFDNLAWDDDPEKFFGIELENNVKLHSVDRKFLHGFWKECFANRQQLFLIFVRAEPMMMGGGGLGQTPPQLGARAVALVWRDPTTTADDVSGTKTSGGPRPHRTRILFYRQFD